jgi:iron complex outermembrane receptor protein
METQTNEPVTLSVSFVGFITQQINVDPKDENQFPLIITLEALIINVAPVEINAAAESRPMDVPMRVEVIGKKEIRTLPVQSIDQTMVSSPGVNVNREFGIYSDKAVVSLRGQSGSDQSRTMVLVDGIPVNKSDGGSVNWNFIQPAMVDHIEITKGPASAKYGSSAMGGAINIVTERPYEAFQVEAQAEAGQWKTFGGRIRISGTDNTTSKHPLWYSVSGMLRSSDGYINQPEETIIMYDSVVVPGFLDEQAAQAKLGYQINKNHQVDAELNFYNDKRGSGIKIYEEDGSWTSHQTWFAKAGYHGNVAKVTIDAKAYYLLENYYKVNEYFSEGEYTLYDVDSRRTDWGGILHLSQEFGAHHKIMLGGEMRQGKVNASDIYYTASDLIDNRGQMDLGSVFLMDEMNFMHKKIQLNAGLRLDVAQFSNGAYTIQNPSYSLEYLLNFQDTVMTDNSWTALSPKLSANYFFRTNMRTYVSVAQGFRAPVLDDMCRSGRRKNGFRVANPNLNPEYITSLEWGFDWQPKENWHVGVSAFYSHGKDYMYAISTGDSVNMGYTISPVYKTQNISGVDISGIEAELSGTIIPQLSVYINYTRNFSEIVDFTPQTAADPDLSGNHLTDVPDHQANGGIVWTNNIVDINLIGKYVGQRWINDRNIPDLTYLMAPQYPAYFNLDINLQKQITNQWLVSLSIQNIFDETHINSRGYITPGRFVMAKIAWRLMNDI